MEIPFCHFTPTLISCYQGVERIVKLLQADKRHHYPHHPKKYLTVERTDPASPKPIYCEWEQAVAGVDSSLCCQL